MFTGVAWGDCDFLIIDTPPGTSDEHITLAQLLADDARFLGAIVISTPQVGSFLKIVLVCVSFGCPKGAGVLQASQYRMHWARRKYEGCHL